MYQCIDAGLTSATSAYSLQLSAIHRWLPLYVGVIPVHSLAVDNYCIISGIIDSISDFAKIVQSVNIGKCFVFISIFNRTNGRCIKATELQCSLKIELPKQQIKLYMSDNKRNDMLCTYLFFSVMLASVRTDVCRCNLCWKDEMSLIIGWAKSIKVQSYFISFSNSIFVFCLNEKMRWRIF